MREWLHGITSGVCPDRCTQANAPGRFFVAASSATLLWKCMVPAATAASCCIAHLVAGPVMTILHGTPFWSESGMHGAVQCVREGTSTWGCAQLGALQAHGHFIVPAWPKDGCCSVVGSVTCACRGHARYPTACTCFVS